MGQPRETKQTDSKNEVAMEQENRESIDSRYTWDNAGKTGKRNK